MSIPDIITWRLASHHLQDAKFQTPEDVVSYMGAVQAQDVGAGIWGIAKRVDHPTYTSIENAFNSGAILRTHIMRPTWHFVRPTDIGWIQKLTSARVKQFMAPYNRKLEITDVLLHESETVLEHALANNTYLTRRELAEKLHEHHIEAIGQRLAHIMMYAEFDGIICSGPRVGKQLTYALLNERAPTQIHLSHDEALATLALRYMTSHGPAQVGDFSWWSGLPLKESQIAIALCDGKLLSETIDGKVYYFSSHPNLPTNSQSSAHLLSIFDEYTIAYKDRSAINDARYVERMLSMGNALTAVMVYGGRVVGTWRHVVEQKKLNIALHPFTHQSDEEIGCFRDAATAYGVFHGMTVHIASKMR
jgi:hypothetical protein